MNKRLETRLQQLEAARTEPTPPKFLLCFLPTDGSPAQYACLTANGLEDVPAPNRAMQKPLDSAPAKRL